MASLTTRDSWGFYLHCNEILNQGTYVILEKMTFGKQQDFCSPFSRKIKKCCVESYYVCGFIEASLVVSDSLM